MVEMTVFCDFCGNRMASDTDNNVKLFRTKEIETRKLFPHLCENCANKLDEAVRFDKSQRVTKGELAARMAKINAERRNKIRLAELWSRYQETGKDEDYKAWRDAKDAEE